jgi:hypothetical protein
MKGYFPQRFLSFHFELFGIGKDLNFLIKARMRGKEMNIISTN